MKAPALTAALVSSAFAASWARSHAESSRWMRPTSRTLQLSPAPCGPCSLPMLRALPRANFHGGFAKSGEEMRRRSGRDWPEQQLNQRDQDSRQTLPLHLLQEFGQGASQNLQRASPCIPVHRISEESGQPAQRQAGPVPSKLSSCGCIISEPAELGLLGSTGSLLFGCLVAMTLFAVPAWRWIVNQGPAWHRRPPALARAFGTRHIMATRFLHVCTSQKQRHDKGCRPLFSTSIMSIFAAGQIRTRNKLTHPRQAQTLTSML